MVVERELIVPITLELPSASDNKIGFKDTFEWDLSNPDNEPEIFAR
jgi:hypothetical protein